MTSKYAQRNSSIGSFSKSLKPNTVKGLRHNGTLRYPMYGRAVVCVSPSRLRYNLICGSNLSLYNVETLIAKFEFFIGQWVYNETGGQRFLREKYRKCIDMLLANLRYAHLEGHQILSPTRKEKTKSDNPANIGYQTVNNTLSFLQFKGFINLVKGKQSEYNGVSTWCEPTAQLVAIFERHGIYSMLHKKTTLVEVRRKLDDGGYEILPITKAQKPTLRKLSAPVKSYLGVWNKHMPTLDGNYVLPWCRRIFNNRFDFGGRFYGSFQQLPKLERERLLIDGELTVEPDFKGLHINLLYSWEDVQFVGDPYSIRGYDRKLVKAVMLPLLNSESLAQLSGQITKSARTDIKQAYREWKESNIEHNRSLAYGRVRPIFNKPDFLKGFIEGIPEGTSGAELIDAIKDKHHVIAHHFGTKHIGVRLQRQDSEIMGMVLDTLSKDGIAALPVHDSVRCKFSDVIVTLDVMKKSYKDITGFDIEISLDTPRSSKLTKRLASLQSSFDRN